MKFSRLYHKEEDFKYFDELFFNEFLKGLFSYLSDNPDKVLSQSDKEARIVSLAKEKNLYLLKKLDTADSAIWLTMAEKVNKARANGSNCISLNYRYGDIDPIIRYFRNLIANIEFEPLDKSCAEGGQSKSPDVVAHINSLIGENLSFTKVSGYYKRYISTAASVSGVDTINVFNGEHEFYSLLGRAHPNKNRVDASFRDGTHVCDAAVYCAFKWIYKQVNTAIKSAYANEDYRLWQDLKSLVYNKEEWYYRYPTVEQWDAGELRECIIAESFAKHKIIPEESALRATDVAAITYYYSNDCLEKKGDTINLLTQLGFSVKPYVDKSRYFRSFLSENVSYYKEATTYNGVIFDLDSMLYIANPFFYKKEIEFYPKTRSDIHAYWMLPYTDSNIEKLFFSIAGKKVSEALFVEHAKREGNESRARSFQQMKNHLKGHEKFMAESELNDYFGLVEVDDDCDLEKTKVVADEIMAFIDKHLPFLSATKDNALRFRKLGNHKAAGLYYPTMLCLCVDIRSPQSFIHELGHLIDNAYGEVSVSYEFQKVLRTYCRLLQKTKGDKKLTGKYDMSYYQTPTEVFARCFELYCYKVLGVTNSLLKTEAEYNEFPYGISDNSLMSDIQVFFDKFLSEKSLEGVA